MNRNLVQLFDTRQDPMEVVAEFLVDTTDTVDSIQTKKQEALRVAEERLERDAYNYSRQYTDRPEYIGLEEDIEEREQYVLQELREFKFYTTIDI